MWCEVESASVGLGSTGGPCSTREYKQFPVIRDDGVDGIRTMDK
jgi:hypothetical protein